MLKPEPIIIVENDLDDQEIMETALRDLGVFNEIFFFNDGDKALEYLKITQVYPVLILSDINMPNMDGVELKKQIDEDLELGGKNIPFVFFTTRNRTSPLNKGDTMLTVLGYFKKGDTYEEVLSTLKEIMDSCNICLRPDVEGFQT